MSKQKNIPDERINRILSAVLRIEEGMNRLLSERARENLSVSEVCALLKISRSTYRRYVDDGIITEKQPGGKNTKILVSRKEIEDLIENGKI
jgi:excisionase family DNA binding protein